MKRVKGDKTPTKDLRKSKLNLKRGKSLPDLTIDEELPDLVPQTLKLSGLGKEVDNQYSNHLQCRNQEHKIESQGDTLRCNENLKASTSKSPIVLLGEEEEDEIAKKKSLNAAGDATIGNKGQGSRVLCDKSGGESIVDLTEVNCKSEDLFKAIDAKPAAKALKMEGNLVKDKTVCSKKAVPAKRGRPPNKRGAKRSMKSNSEISSKRLQNIMKTSIDLDETSEFTDAMPIQQYLPDRVSRNMNNSSSQPAVKPKSRKPTPEIHSQTSLSSSSGLQDPLMKTDLVSDQGKSTECHQAESVDNGTCTKEAEKSQTCLICQKSVPCSQFNGHFRMCLQQFKSDKCKKTVEDDEDITEAIQSKELRMVATEIKTCICQICQKSLTHLNSHLRTAHMNKCMDKMEADQREKEGEQNALEAMRTAVLECPICGQKLKTDASRKAHLKKCSLKYKVSTERVLEMARQQKEEHQLKVAAGILPEKPRISRKKKAEKSESGTTLGQARKPADEEMQVAMAMSASLLEEDKKMKESLLPTTGCEDAQDESKKGKKKTRDNKSNEPLLLCLTKEESRKRTADRITNCVLIQNVAEIPTTPEAAESKVGTRLQMKEKHGKNALQVKMASGHWEKCSSDIHDGAVENYYVPELMPPIQVSSITTGSKLKRLSMIPGRRRSRDHVTEEPSYKDMTSSPATTQTAAILAELAADGDDDMVLEPDASNKALDSQLVSNRRSSSSSNGPASGFCPAPFVTVEDHDSNALLTAFCEDISLLVNSRLYSDVQIVAAKDETIHAHKIFLALRCPKIMELVDDSGTSNRIPLPDYSQEAILSIIKFIYCGKVEIQLSELSEIISLCDRFDLHYLKKICRDAQEKSSHATEALLEAAVAGSVNCDDDNVSSPTKELFNLVWSDEEDNSEQGRHVCIDDGVQDDDDDEMDDLYEYMFTQRDLVSKGNLNLCGKTSVEKECDLKHSISCTNSSDACVSDDTHAAISTFNNIDNTEGEIVTTNLSKPVRDATEESESNINKNINIVETNSEAIADNIVKSEADLSSVGTMMMSTCRDEENNAPCVPETLISHSEFQRNIFKNLNFEPGSFVKNDDIFDRIISSNDHYQNNNDNKDEAPNDLHRVNQIDDIRIMSDNETATPEDDIVSLVTEDDIELFLSESEDCLDDDATIKPEEPSAKNCTDDICDQTTPIVAIPVGYVDEADGKFHQYDETNDENCGEDDDEDDGSWLIPATPVDKTFRKSNFVDVEKSIIRTDDADEKEYLYGDKFTLTLTNSVNKTNTEPMEENKNSLLILAKDDKVSFSLRNIEGSLVSSQIERKQEMHRNLHNSESRENLPNLVERINLDNKSEPDTNLKKTRLSLEQEYNLIDCSVSLSPLPKKVVESRKVTVSTPICGNLDMRSCRNRSLLQLSPVLMTDSLYKEEDVEIIGDNFNEIDNECNSHSPVFGYKRTISEIETSVFTYKDRDKNFRKEIKFDADSNDGNVSNKKRKLDSHDVESETSPSFKKKMKGSAKYKFKKPRRLTPESQNAQQVILSNNENEFYTDADMNVNTIEKHSKCDGHEMTLIVDKNDMYDTPKSNHKLNIPNASLPINRQSSELSPKVIENDFLPIPGVGPFVSDLCNDEDNYMKPSSDKDNSEIARDRKPAITSKGVIVHHLSGTRTDRVTIEVGSSPVDIQLDDFSNLDDPSENHDLPPVYRSPVPYDDVWDGFDDCGMETCDMPLLETQGEATLDNNDDDLNTGAEEDNPDEPMPVLERSIDLTDANAEDDAQSEDNTEQNVKPVNTNLKDEDDSFPADEVNPSDDDIPELDECPQWDQGQPDEEGAWQPETDMKTPVVRSVRPKKRQWIPPSPFTPMPGYSDMNTPNLKKAVKQFGVHPLPKKKMVLLLSEIYKQTHQYETDSEFEASFTISNNVPSLDVDGVKEASNRPVSSRPRKPGKTVDGGKRKGKEPSISSSTNEDVLSIDESSDEDSSQISMDSCDDHRQILEETCMFNDEVEMLSQAPTSDLHQKLLQLIRGNKTIHTSMLHYEPLDLCVLKKLVVEAGIKCAEVNLVKFLDEKCITFTVKNSRGQNQRRQGRKTKVPKKKKNIPKDQI